MSGTISMAKTRPGNRAGSSSVAITQGSEVWGTNMTTARVANHSPLLAVAIGRTNLGALILLSTCWLMTQTTLGAMSRRRPRDKQWCLIGAGVSWHDRSPLSFWLIPFGCLASWLLALGTSWQAEVREFPSASNPLTFSPGEL